MKNNLISKNVSVGKKAFHCYPGAQAVTKKVAKEEQKKETENK